MGLTQVRPKERSPAVLIIQRVLPPSPGVAGRVQASAGSNCPIVSPAIARKVATSAADRATPRSKLGGRPIWRPRPTRTPPRRWRDMLPTPKRLRPGHAANYGSANPTTFARRVVSHVLSGGPRGSKEVEPRVKSEACSIPKVTLVIMLVRTRSPARTNLLLPTSSATALRRVRQKLTRFLTNQGGFDKNCVDFVQS